MRLLFVAAVFLLVLPPIVALDEIPQLQKREKRFLLQGFKIVPESKSSLPKDQGLINSQVMYMRLLAVMLEHEVGTQQCDQNSDCTLAYRGGVCRVPVHEKTRKKYEKFKKSSNYHWIYSKIVESRAGLPRGFCVEPEKVVCHKGESSKGYCEGQYTKKSQRPGRMIPEPIS